MDHAMANSEDIGVEGPDMDGMPTRLIPHGQLPLLGPGSPIGGPGFPKRTARRATFQEVTFAPLMEVRFIAELKSDFEASLIFVQPEGWDHRKSFVYTGPVCWRPEFVYDGDDRHWLVFPIDYRHVDGREVAIGEVIPKHVYARMSILSEDLKPMHRARLHVGTHFLIMEGYAIVAKGTVTRLTGIVVD